MAERESETVRLEADSRDHMDLFVLSTEIKQRCNYSRFECVVQQME